MKVVPPRYVSVFGHFLVEDAVTVEKHGAYAARNSLNCTIRHFDIIAPGFSPGSGATSSRPNSAEQGCSGRRGTIRDAIMGSAAEASRRDYNVGMDFRTHSQCRYRVFVCRVGRSA